MNTQNQKENERDLLEYVTLIVIGLTIGLGLLFMLIAP